jgi:hypothetical protein
MSSPRTFRLRAPRLPAARPGRAGSLPLLAAALLLAVVAGPAGFAAGTEAGAAGLVRVEPRPYAGALRNPLKGITARTLGEHKWGTLTHHYIAWDEIEARESDGVEQIRAFCDAKWAGFPGQNVKIIPRVYLDYPGQERKRWPADLQTDDYESPEFARRLTKLVEKLGAAWDADPRVAFVELGIFGKWGEQHSPEPSAHIQQVAAEAFRRAFPHKQVSVRQIWAHFPGAPVGEYWDSFAHYDQMRDNGAAIAALNESQRLYEKHYIGGEVAYDWGHWELQPGASPTATLAVPAHREFMVNTIRWLHCTQLRWIGDYEPGNAAAEAGAQEIQEALGYRFVLEEARFSAQVARAGGLRVELRVTNTGSAPFYYDWPVEVALLAPDTHQVVWRANFPQADVRTWLPGDGWTPPSWRRSAATNQEEAFWPAASECGWAKPPVPVNVAGVFRPEVPRGRYLLAVAVLDPAGMLPSLRFATANYLNGGRHPLGFVGVDGETGGALPADFVFADPQQDQSLKYVVPARPAAGAGPGGARN